MPLKANAQKVFTDAQETHLSTYAMKMAKMFYGLPIKEFRRIAYEYAIACESPNMPIAWERGMTATTCWYYLFMGRHPELILKSPEGISIARTIAFNKISTVPRLILHEKSSS